ncbi:MAG: dTDP-4-dehydrorhamnose reductase [Planctomycetaceae bacterium]
MRIALFGPRGQLGTALRSCLAGDVALLARDEVDVSDPAAVEAALRRVAPTHVVNCTAYNFVDKAEDEPAQAFAVNALGPCNLARACAALDAALLHVSTDYVFGLDVARQRPYSESDLPGPLGAYAVSKLAGEQFVQSQCQRHFVVRTCGLYGRAESPGKGNFIETMLRLGRERGEVSVVDDQWCTPTAALDLARWLARLLETESYGLYHATNAGAITWRQLAEEIFRQAGLSVVVRPITTAQFGAKARRPAYSVLDTSRLAGTIGERPRAWQEALAEYLAQRGADGRR